MSVVVVLGLLILLVLAKMPVGMAMALSGAVGLYWVGGSSALMGILSTTPYRQSASWILISLPLFILMAELLHHSGMASRLFQAVRVWFRRVPGAVALSTVVASAIFGAVAGSSSAVTATMARVAVPEMRASGYDDRLSGGVVASAGTIAMMIPPSIVMIFYGILTETSIGQMFLAGIIPGLMTTFVYVVLIIGWSMINPAIAGRGVGPEESRGRVVSASRNTEVGSRELPATVRSVNETGGEDHNRSAAQVTLFGSLVSVIPVLGLFVIVMGGIYSGYVTITEAGGAGAAGAAVLAAASRQLSWAQIRESLRQTTQTSAMIFMVLIGAHIFGYFLTLAQVTQSAIRYIAGLEVPDFTILALFLVMYLFLGFVMSQTAVLVLTLPLVFPIIQSMGFDAVWFGILVVKTVEIGLATPPLGLNVFIASGSGGTSLSDTFRGAGRFVGADLIVLLLILFFPWFALAFIN